MRLIQYLVTHFEENHMRYILKNELVIVAASIGKNLA